MLITWYQFIRVKLLNRKAREKAKQAEWFYKSVTEQDHNRKQIMTEAMFLFVSLFLFASGVFLWFPLQKDINNNNDKNTEHRKNDWDKCFAFPVTSYREASRYEVKETEQEGTYCVGKKSLTSTSTYLMCLCLNKILLATCLLRPNTFISDCFFVVSVP